MTTLTFSQVTGRRPTFAVLDALHADGLSPESVVWLIKNYGRVHGAGLRRMAGAA